MKIGMMLSFYIKEQTQKKNRNLSFKNYYFGPPKKRVFGLWRKTANFFSSCFAEGMLWIPIRLHYISIRIRKFAQIWTLKIQFKNFIRRNNFFKHYKSTFMAYRESAELRSELLSVSEVIFRIFYCVNQGLYSEYGSGSTTFLNT